MFLRSLISRLDYHIHHISQEFLALIHQNQILQRRRNDGRGGEYRFLAITGALTLGALALLLEFSVIGAFFSISFIGVGLGDFFVNAYGILAFIIPAYLVWAACILIDPNYQPARIFTLNAAVVPFLTLAIGVAIFRDFDIQAERIGALKQLGRVGFSFFVILFTFLEAFIIRACVFTFFPPDRREDPRGDSPGEPAEEPPVEEWAELGDEDIPLGEGDENRHTQFKPQILLSAKRFFKQSKGIWGANGILRSRGLFRAVRIFSWAEVLRLAPRPSPVQDTPAPPPDLQLDILNFPEPKPLASVEAFKELETLTRYRYTPPEAPPVLKPNFERPPEGALEKPVDLAPAQRRYQALRELAPIPRPAPPPVPVEPGREVVPEPILRFEVPEPILLDQGTGSGARVPEFPETPEVPEGEREVEPDLDPLASGSRFPRGMDWREEEGEEGEFLPEPVMLKIEEVEVRELAEFLDELEPVDEQDLSEPVEPESLDDRPRLPRGPLPRPALPLPPREGERVRGESPAIRAKFPAVSRAEPEPPKPLANPPKKWWGGSYQIPLEGILNQYPDGQYWIIDQGTRDAAEILRRTLEEFKIQAEVTGIRKGPVITMFEILPAPGVKLSKIVNLQDNIALRLAASSVRIVAPIPGKHAVGIEVPNKKRNIVSFRELIEGELLREEERDSRRLEIPVVLGKDITGEAQTADLAQMPHLLIAGATGSGKSVCVNSMILSIMYQRSPMECRLILIDPKIVELKLYNDTPHLLTPVITEPKRAFQALQYCIYEMERRYACLDSMGVRDIKSYNRRIKERNIAAESMPYIVVVIDEFADLMATTGKELESTVARLAAMSRAVGIHLILATQRPSIDVITGLIKANIPSRIAFMVASKMDSRIIIDMVGAEKLLGKGDMLYAGAVDPFPVRMQGAFVSEEEVERVVEHIKTLGAPDYIDDEIFFDDEEEDSASLFSEGDDPLYDQALEIVFQQGKASASYIQRRLKIGYNRAARLVEEMETRGVVGPAQGSKPRELLRGA